MGVARYSGPRVPPRPHRVGPGQPLL